MIRCGRQVRPGAGSRAPVILLPRSTFLTDFQQGAGNLTLIGEGGGRMHWNPTRGCPYKPRPGLLDLLDLAVHLLQRFLDGLDQFANGLLAGLEFALGALTKI